MRRGFTLIELLVVIGIMLILAALTIGAINLSITSEQVRSAARLVQSKIEGAKDRAIYAQQPRGIRILVNEEITEDVDGKEIATLATTLVYIGSPGEDTSEPDYNDENQNGDTSELRKYIQVVNAHPDPPNTPGFPNQSPSTPMEVVATRTIIGVNTRWSALYEQGLIGPGTVIRISPHGVEDARRSDEFFTIDPRSFPVRTEREWFGDTGPVNVDPPPPGGHAFYGDVNQFDDGTPNGRRAPFSDDLNDDGLSEENTGPPEFLEEWGTDEVLFLITEGRSINDFMIGSGTAVSQQRWAYVMETNPDVLPGEEPSVLPRNTCIDLHTSHLPANWLTSVPNSNPPPPFFRQYSNRMDILFSPNGSIVGTEGAAGLIHLHVCDVADAMADFPPGSPFRRYEDPPGSGNFVIEGRNGDEFGITIFTRSGRVNVHPMIAVDLDRVDHADPDDPYQIKGSTYPPNGPLREYGGNGIGQYDPQNPPTNPQVGNIIAPSIYNGLIYKLVIDNGSGSGNEPNWNTNPGGLTVDDGQTWIGIKHDVWSLGVEGVLAR